MIRNSSYGREREIRAKVNSFRFVSVTAFVSVVDRDNDRDTKTSFEYNARTIFVSDSCEPILDLGEHAGRIICLQSSPVRGAGFRYKRADSAPRFF